MVLRCLFTRLNHAQHMVKLSLKHEIDLRFSVDFKHRDHIMEKIAITVHERMGFAIIGLQSWT